MVYPHLGGLMIVGRITDVIVPLAFEFLRWSADQSNRELRQNGIWSKGCELYLLLNFLLPYERIDSAARGPRIHTKSSVEWPP